MELIKQGQELNLAMGQGVSFKNALVRLTWSVLCVWTAWRITRNRVLFRKGLSWDGYDELESQALYTHWEQHQGKALEEYELSRLKQALKKLS